MPVGFIQSTEDLNRKNKKAEKKGTSTTRLQSWGSSLFQSSNSHGNTYQLFLSLPNLLAFRLELTASPGSQVFRLRQEPCISSPGWTVYWEQTSALVSLHVDTCQSIHIICVCVCVCTYIRLRSLWVLNIEIHWLCFSGELWLIQASLSVQLYVQFLNRSTSQLTSLSFSFPTYKMGIMANTFVTKLLLKWGNVN